MMVCFLQRLIGSQRFCPVTSPVIANLREVVGNNPRVNGRQIRLQRPIFLAHGDIVHEAVFLLTPLLLR
jgi:hypothetical protein